MVVRDTASEWVGSSLLHDVGSSQSAHGCNIIDAVASKQRERSLVIVGSAHKAYLDRLLAGKLSIRLVQLNEPD